MIQNLMKEETVTVQSIAESISNWLYCNFIEKLDKRTIQEPKSLETFFETIMNVNMSITTKLLQQVVHYSSQLLIKSFGYDFKFVGRQEAMKKIEETFKLYSNNYTISGVDKQYAYIPFAAAAPGVGKSKLLQEVSISLFNTASTITYQNCMYFPIFVTFGSGSSIVAQEKHLDASISLCIRVIYSLYRGICNPNNAKGFEQFVEGLLKYFGSNLPLSINYSLNFIRDTLHRLFKTEIGNRQIRFTIAIDEVHNIDGHNSDKRLSPLRAVLSDIGNYLTAQASFIVHPIIAGTYHTVIDRNFESSTFYTVFVPLKGSLSVGEQAELLDSLASIDVGQGLKYHKLKNWRANTDFRRYLRSFGGFPRGIEYYLQYFLYENYTAVDSWNAAAANLKQNYSRIRTIDFKHQIGKLVITRKLLLKTDNVWGLNESKATISELENIGAIVLDVKYYPENKFIGNYPAILLENCFDDHLRVLFKHAFLNFFATTWQTWEQIVHIHTFILFSMFKDEDNIRLAQLVPFALKKN